MTKDKAALKVAPEPEAPEEEKKFAVKYKTIIIEIELTTRMYGGIPQGEELLRAWIEAKGPIPEETLQEKVEAMTPAEVGEKVDLSSTAFRSDSEGIYLRDFMVKQMFKECATVTGLTTKKRGSKNILTIGLVVKPEFIKPYRNGRPLKKEDGFEEFQGRVKTMQGPRSILSRKAYLEPGTRIPFEVKFLVGTVTADDLRILLEHAGEFVGFGSARSREAGKFKIARFDVV